jgi:adenylosuccinate lyase
MVVPPSRRTGRINKKQHLYANPYVAHVQTRPEVTRSQLKNLADWSDELWQACNVLHWGTTTNDPNDYTTAARLLLTAVDNLVRLHAVTEAARAVTE